MDASTAISQVAVALITPRFMGELAAYFRVPSVIGEIVAGIILGPALLLFQVGLETDIGELADAGTKSVVVAIAGFELPIITCFALGYYWFNLKNWSSLCIYNKL